MELTGAEVKCCFKLTSSLAAANINSSQAQPAKSFDFGNHIAKDNDKSLIVNGNLLDVEYIHRYQNGCLKSEGASCFCRESVLLNLLFPAEKLSMKNPRLMEKLLQPASTLPPPPANDDAFIGPLPPNTSSVNVSNELTESNPENTIAPDIIIDRGSDGSDSEDSEMIAPKNSLGQPQKNIETAIRHLKRALDQMRD